MTSWKQLIATALLSLGAITQCTAQCAKSETLTVNERYLRRRIQKEILPRFPDKALKDKKTGVVVVAVEVDIKGIVAEAAIVQSPNEKFDTSSLEAVKQWRFEPMLTPKNELLCLKSKLTFYFSMSDGQGRVEHPKIFQKRVTKSS